MKKYLVLATLLMTVMGCSAVSPKKTVEVKLTQEELSQVGNNKNMAASILVKKSVLKEMSEYTYTPEEEKALNDALENVQLEFYLNNLASKKVTVTDEEVLSVYNANADKLKNVDQKQVLPQIKQQILLQKIANERTKYMNSLVDKYDLNTLLNIYFPAPQQQK